MALAAGYLGRAWQRGGETSLAQAEANALVRAPTGQLRLCGWNIERLGHKNGKDYPLVRRIIEDHCDAAVLLEVMQKHGAAGGYARLREQLGPSWTGLLTKTPRPNTNSGNSEFYAIVYRRGALETCDGFSELVYAPDGDGGSDHRLPDRFIREPAFGCFRLRGPKGEFDFLLGAFHAKAHRKPAEQARTEAEVSALSEAIDSLRKLRPGENDVLIVGDFNLTPSELQRVTKLIPLQRGLGSTLNDRGGRSAHLYDGALVQNPGASPEVARNAEVLDVRKYASNARVFSQTVSDHLPIQVLLTVLGKDDD